MVHFDRDDWRTLGRRVGQRARAAAQALRDDGLPRQVGDNVRGLRSTVLGNAGRARRRWDDARAQAQRRADLRRQRRRAAWQRFLKRLRWGMTVLAIVLVAVFALRLVLALTKDPARPAAPTPAAVSR